MRHKQQLVNIAIVVEKKSKWNNISYYYSLSHKIQRTNLIISDFSYQARKNRMLFKNQNIFMIGNYWLTIILFDEKVQFITIQYIRY